MPHVLRKRVERVRRRWIMTRLFRNLAMGAVIVWALLLVVAAADYWIRPSQRIWRVALSTAVLLPAVAFVLWCLLDLARSRSSLLGIAYRIEQRFPSLRDRLRSALEFVDARRTERQLGSVAFQERLISAVARETEPYDFREAVETRPVRRLVLCVMILFVASGAWAISRPAWTRTAMARIADPLSSRTWPQRHRLAVRDVPGRLLVGTPFRIKVIDEAGPLPAVVTLHQRDLVPDGEVVTQEYSPQGSNLVIEQPGVRESFEFWVTGGDDHTMRPHRVYVIPRVQLEEWKLRLHPPAYTGLPSYEADPSFTAFGETRVTLQGRATRPLEQAAVQFDDGRRISLRLGADRQLFYLNEQSSPAWTLEHSGEYWLEWKADGWDQSTKGQPWRFTLRMDEPPTTETRGVEDGETVTPVAQVPLTIHARDDLAIRSVDWRILKNDGDGIEIAVYESSVPPPMTVGQVHNLLASGRKRRIPFTWDLTPLNVAEGDVLSGQAIASDFVPQTGAGEMLRIPVVSPEAKLAELRAEARSLNRDGLSRLIGLQKRALQATQRCLELLSTSEGNSRAVKNGLGQGWRRQQEVALGIMAEPNGLRAGYTGLAKRFAWNRLDDPAFHTRLREVEASLRELVEKIQPDVERQFSLLTELNDLSPDARPTFRYLLARQRAALELLTRLQNAAGIEDTLHALRSRVAELRDAQQQVASDTLRTLQNSLGSRNESTEVDSREARGLARRQRQLSANWQDIASEMAGLTETASAEGDGEARRSLVRAIEEARRRDISRRFSDAVEALAGQEFGTAVQFQAETMTALEALAETLHGDTEREALGSYAEQVERIAGEQDRIAERLRQSLSGSEELRSLADREKQLAAATEDLAQRATAISSADPLRQASRSMKESAEAAHRGDQTSAAQHAEQARQELAAALESSSHTSSEASPNQAPKRPEMLAAALLKTQQSLLDRTETHLKAVVPQDKVASVETASEQIANEQAELATRTTEIAEQFTASAGLQYAFRKAAGHMRQAARALREAEPSSAPFEQRRAIVTLERIQASRPSPTAEEPQESPATREGEESPTPREDEALQEELLLIQGLQADLHRACREFLRQADSDPHEFDAEDSRRWAALAQEQGELARMLDTLLSAAKQNPPSE